jgi:putative hemolysin
VLVDGRTHWEDVRRYLGVQLESEEFDTIGGYVFGLFGRQPKKGESIEADSLQYVVADTDGRRIQRLRITKLAPSEPDEANLLNA